MRILHFADVHIGVENYGRTDPDTGLSTRLGDFLQTLDELVEYAIDTRVDLALFCGDAYKNRDPNQTHQREFAKRIIRLSSEGIPTFLVVGNHDMPLVTSRASALEIFPTLSVSKVYTGDSITTQVIPTNDGPIQIVSLPWIRRSNFLAREETRGMTQEKLNETIQHKLTELIRIQAESLDPKLPAIFAGHVSVGDASTGSEQWMMLGRDHVLLKSAVGLPQFDYVALGHVHKYQQLGTNPRIVYSGSIQRVDFGEEKDPKGFCIIELDPTAYTGHRLKHFEFHEVDARNFVTIPVQIRNDDIDPTNTVLKEIGKYHIEKAIVRVMISVAPELEGHLNSEKIRGALQDAHFVASVTTEVTSTQRTRLGGTYSGTTDPRDVLRLYLSNIGIAADRSKIIMEHAEKLMEEIE
ncbi:MAG TPA: hypothetical protein DGN60_01895 [Chloroflexi bacterium]|nr:hypothetical protein [Chloroflexota bacterium]|tara:strand:- start:1419 stop:2648 length:1230 start_codon:yes stop_codon:yes gene_type:complete